MAVSKYTDRIENGIRQHGNKFDSTELDTCPDIIHFYNATNARVRIEGPFGVRFGRISTTTGWRPTFLLMHRMTDIGSSDLLGPDDRVTGVQVSGRYQPAMSVHRSKELL
jgi:hypothetical protein